MASTERRTLRRTLRRFLALCRCSFWQFFVFLFFLMCVSSVVATRIGTSSKQESFLSPIIVYVHCCWLWWCSSDAICEAIWHFCWIWNPDQDEYYDYYEIWFYGLLNRRDDHAIARDNVKLYSRMAGRSTHDSHVDTETTSNSTVTDCAHIISGDSNSLETR